MRLSWVSQNKRTLKMNASRLRCGGGGFRIGGLYFWNLDHLLFVTQVCESGPKIQFRLDVYESGRFLQTSNHSTAWWKLRNLERIKRKEALHEVYLLGMIISHFLTWVFKMSERYMSFSKFLRLKNNTGLSSSFQIRKYMIHC